MSKSCCDKKSWWGEFMRTHKKKQDLRDSAKYSEDRCKVGVSECKPGSHKIDGVCIRCILDFPYVVAKMFGTSYVKFLEREECFAEDMTYRDKWRFYDDIQPLMEHYGYTVFNENFAKDLYGKYNPLKW